MRFVRSSRLVRPGSRPIRNRPRLPLLGGGGGGGGLPSPTSPPVVVARTETGTTSASQVTISAPGSALSGDKVLFAGICEASDLSALAPAMSNTSGTILETINPTISYAGEEGAFIVGWYEYTGTAGILTFGTTVGMSCFQITGWRDAGDPLSREGVGWISDSTTDSSRTIDPMVRGDGAAYWRVTGGTGIYRTAVGDAAAPDIDGDLNWAQTLFFGIQDDGVMTDNNSWGTGEAVPFSNYSTTFGSDASIAVMAAIGKSLDGSTIGVAATDTSAWPSFACAVAVPGL